MAPQPWDDQALVAELMAALDEADSTAPEHLAAARAVWTWRTIDDELALAELAFDSAYDLAPTGLVRSSGWVRTLAFRSPALTVEIEVTAAGIAGQVVPAGEGEVVGLSPAGPFDSAPIDEVGCFVLDPAPPGPVRLRTHAGGHTLVTNWVTLTPGTIR